LVHYTRLPSRLISRTYAMIRKADTLGTFQIESRAQMAMLPRISIMFIP
jgi:DNA polymerase III alpha subunit